MNLFMYEVILNIKQGEDGCEVQGGTVDGLIVHAAISSSYSSVFMVLFVK